MNSVTGILVVQNRVFAPETVPYRLIITPLGTSLLTQALGFREASWNQENWDYIFQDGVFEYQGINIPIIWLGFNDRRIVIQVQGDSSAAVAAYHLVSAQLSKLDPNYQDPEPLLFTEETSCSARLDFPWTALLSPPLVEHVARQINESSTEELQVAVKGMTLRFTLGTARKDSLFDDYGVTIFDQTIAIEPKTNVPLSEQIYFTYSPYDSNTHLKLVSELEASLSSKASRSEQTEATRRTQKKIRRPGGREEVS